MKQYSMWIWLAQKCGAASSEAPLLWERLGSVEEIYESDFDTYTRVGVSERLAEDLCDKSLEQANEILRYCQKNGIGILTYADEEYPSGLRAIRNPPAVLYYLGELPNFNDRLLISMVGTRSMSEYGMRAAYKIAYEAAAAGAVIVSGMALGIDAVSAAAAIKAGGSTVAVLGCGVDRIYPKRHSKLKEQIIKHGAVISEFAPSTEPIGANFPIRNRIISGLSQGTLVVDADLGSGAMITAKTAILQGRDIYAVPSNIDSQNSSGTNSLIRDGAQAVLCGKDIIGNYTFTYREGLNMFKLYDAEKHSDVDLAWLTLMGVGSRGDGIEALSAHTSKPAYKEKAVKKNKGFSYAEAGERAGAAHEAGKTANVVNAVKEDAYKKDTPYNRGAQSDRDRNGGDRSLEILAQLNEKQRLVFDEMPLDRAVTVDYLTRVGMKLGEVMSALTVLEVKGLVVSLPGALYIRK